MFLINLLVFRGRPLFWQRRIGYREQVFCLWKFKSLRSLHDAQGHLLPDEQRTTPWGNWLRRTHLDEWPQLFQIIRGQLSWVGPRPLLPEYLPYYTPEERVRHAVRPGLTGMAQTKGGHALPWSQRLRLDVEYTQLSSFTLDTYLVICTFKRSTHPKKTPFSERLDHVRLEQN